VIKGKEINMPGEVIDRPNPQPLASQIPESVLDLSVKLEKINLNEADLRALEAFRRASNYIAAGKFPKIQSPFPWICFLGRCLNFV
jgi:hypothetical protein